MAAVAPAPASAAAWIAPEDGQEIWTNAVGLRGEDEVAFYETSAYYELPFNQRVAVVAAPFFEQAYDVGEEGWRAEATLAIKTAVLRQERTAVAIQGGVVWNSWPDFGCAETGAELRFLAGRSFGQTGFLNAELAGRAYGGGACGGSRIDVTAGYRPEDNWLALGQVFMDAPYERGETVKAQISVVRFGDGGRGLQVGLRARIDDGVSEPALIVGLWGRPGE